jgi:T5SS/PEP-CTERM-associated repeat protein
VTVTGAGSQWLLSGTQLIVGLGGNGTLNVGNGGTVIAQNGVRLGNNPGSSGTLNISSGGILETTGIIVGTRCAAGKA